MTAQELEREHEGESGQDSQRAGVLPQGPEQHDQRQVRGGLRERQLPRLQCRVECAASRVRDSRQPRGQGRHAEEDAERAHRHRGEREMKRTQQGEGHGRRQDEVQQVRGIEKGRLDVGQERPTQADVRVPERQAPRAHRVRGEDLVQQVELQDVLRLEEARGRQAGE